MTIKYFKDYIKSINEGLIKTYSGEIISNRLEKSLLGLNLNFKVGFLENHNKIELTFNYFNAIPSSSLDGLFDIIDSIVVNTGGWFPSQMDITNIHGMKNSLRYNLDDLYLNHSHYFIVVITYEAKFDGEINPIPDRLYHLSIGEYKNKIINFGLQPRSKDKLTSHLDRIYLCASISDCEDLISRMKLYYNQEKSFNIFNKVKRKYDKNTIPVIFEIDNSSNFIKKLYKDPNYENGVYTLDNIPPDKIRLVR